MPSIIGNSTISGITLSFTGPTGFTGPIGPRGPLGPPGLTLGPTGATGLYIKDVISDVANNTITFKLSDNRNIGPIFGFTGPTVNFSASKAVDAFSAANYKSFLMGVCGGLTFEFRGICGDGQIVFPALSSDGTEIILTIGTITGGVSYGNTANNRLMYSTPSGQLSATHIRVNDSGVTEGETSALFSTQPPSQTLNLGLTFGVSAQPNVLVYSDFTESYVSIPGIARNSSPALPITGVSGIDSGGYILNLDTSSVFKLSTPLGITAFYRNPGYTRKYADEGIGNDSITLDSWLLFIDGADVWNLPSNLLFNTDNSTGIGSFGFCKGMNIVRVQSDYQRGVYYATFVDRCFGDDADSLQYGGVGSCCHSGGCEDYVTQDYCTDVLQGNFTALKNCKQSCNIGSCCINGICRDNVTRDVCEHFTGSVNAWSSTPCPSGDGTACVIGTKTYSLQKTNTTEPVALLSNTTRAAPQKVGEFRVICDDTSFKITAPSFITDTASVSYGLFSFKQIPAQFGSDIDGTGTAELTFSAPVIGTTFAIYFDNNGKTITNQIYPVLQLPLVIRDSSGVIQSGITFNVRPVFASSGCGSDPNSVKIKTAFKLTRYCTDCYTMSTNGKYYYPIQEQTGTFDYCYNTATGARTILCASNSGTKEINSCNLTDGDVVGPPPSGFNVGCVHSQYKYLDSILGVTGGRCFNSDEDGCGCEGPTNTECCCGTCFKPEMDPTSPNYGLCVYADNGCTWESVEDPNMTCAKYAKIIFQDLRPTDPIPESQWPGTVWRDSAYCDDVGGGVDPTGGFDSTLGLVVPPLSKRRVISRSGSDSEPRGNSVISSLANRLYYYTISYWPTTDQLKGQLSLAGITGVTAELGWIDNSIRTLQNPSNNKNVFFTKENNSVNISFSGSGITCCNYEDYEPVVNSTVFEVNWTPPAPNTEVRYFVVNGLDTSTSYWPCVLPGDCGSDGGGGPQTTGLCCNSFPIEAWWWYRNEDLFIKCVFNTTSSPKTLASTPCVVSPLKDALYQKKKVQPACGGNNPCIGDTRYAAALPAAIVGGRNGLLELTEANATLIDGKKYAVMGISFGYKNDILFGYGAYYKNYIQNTTNASLDDTTTQLVNAIVRENVQKPRYCPCSPTSTGFRICTEGNCTIPGSSCFARNHYNNYWDSACTSSGGSIIRIVSLVQDPDNTQTATGYNTFEPRIHEIHLATNTATLLTNSWLYYSTGRLLENSDKDTLNSMTAPSGLTANIKAIKSGTRFTVPLIDNFNRFNEQPIGNVCLYWTDTDPGVKEDFFARTKQIKETVFIDPTEYTNSIGQNKVFDLQLPDTHAMPDINIIDNTDSFDLEITIPDSVLNQLTATGWSLRAWSYNLWTIKQPETGGPTPVPYNETRSSNGVFTPTDNEFVDATEIFGPFTYNNFPTDQFSNTNYAKLQLTTTLLVVKDIQILNPPGDTAPSTDGVEDYRVAQYSQIYEVLRPGANPRLTTDTRSSGKIITANGQSQCVQINCVEFGDCLGMEDC